VSEHPSFGDAVREAREAAGLTLEQVSARTKIRPVVLLDLEAGSTARSGGDAYARGHLRAIAAVTGTDPEVLLSAHAGCVPVPGTDQPVPAGPIEVRAATGSLGLPTAARERGGPRWGVAGAAAAAVIAVLLLLGTLSGSQDPAPATVGGSAPVASAPPAVAVAEPPPVQPAGAALRLQVTGDASWVDVLAAGGQTLFRGVLSAGAAREFKDPARLSVTVGNAGAVTVGCGASAVAAGSRGQVRRYTCAPGGLVPT